MVQASARAVTSCPRRDAEPVVLKLCRSFHVVTVPTLTSEYNRELFYFSHRDFFFIVKMTVKCCTSETVQHLSCVRLHP